MKAVSSVHHQHPVPSASRVPAGLSAWQRFQHAVIARYACFCSPSPAPSPEKPPLRYRDPPFPLKEGCIPELCTLPAENSTVCEQRCACEWVWSINTCSCIDHPLLPICQRHYPIPDNSSLEELARTGGGIVADDRITLFGDSLTW